MTKDKLREISKPFLDALTDDQKKKGKEFIDAMHQYQKEHPVKETVEVIEFKKVPEEIREIHHVEVIEKPVPVVKYELDLELKKKLEKKAEKLQELLDGGVSTFVRMRRSFTQIVAVHYAKLIGQLKLIEHYYTGKHFPWNRAIKDMWLIVETEVEELEQYDIFFDKPVMDTIEEMSEFFLRTMIDDVEAKDDEERIVRREKHFAEANKKIESFKVVLGGGQVAV